jgi:prophage regulatory protein
MVTILRRPELCRLVGLGYTTIHRMIRAGDFPSPIPLGPKAVGWRSDEVQEWIDARTCARDCRQGGDTR